ncbi:MAG TPA: winged helix-turn-helix transcriptional regulator [Tetragenococcus sp.]|nr:winged helix-turn-helix transcriptional regulator [Tetragenococcus sp.]
MKELDSTDLKIIELLAHNSRIKLKILAEQVSLSEPSVKTRIERLADQGIIRSFTIDIDYAKLGYNLSFLI